MRSVIYIIGICVITLSCKKDKLEGERAILIGKWNWTHTVHIYGICDGDDLEETLTPESEGKTFSIELFENGIIKFHENDKIIRKDRLVFTQFGEPCKGMFLEYKSFDFYLNNNDKDRSALFGGCVDDTEIVVLQGFPFEVYEIGCEFYGSHFIKQ